MNYIALLQAQIDKMIAQFVASLPTLAIGLTILVLTWFLAKFAVKIADLLTKNVTIRENLKQLIDTLVRTLIWIVGVMTAASVVMPGLTPGSIFAGLGIGALAIGFAFQDIFENFLAGVLIMIRDRMRIGDSIECQSISGQIERITLRETHIRQPSNELTIVPNSVLFKNPVKITTDSPHRRFEIMVGVVSDYDLDQAAEAIRQGVAAVKDVDDSHPVDVFAREFQPGSVNFLVRWWSAARAKDFVLQDQVIRRVKQALDEAKIEIAGAQPTTIEMKRPPEPASRAAA
jgi:small conductance mechanosensitive channel